MSSFLISEILERLAKEKLEINWFSGKRILVTGGAGFLSKHTLITAYRNQVKDGTRQQDRDLLKKIRLKPMRTMSGVTTVTVLTKPYPCPGQCIFCPDYEEMPVSYLPDEPGAMRAGGIQDRL